MPATLRPLALLALLSLTACATVPPAAKTPPAPPAMQWDHRSEASEWTAATFAALSSYGAPLVEVTPADIAEWCPAYPQADQTQRAAFWSGMLSALAKHESTWNPRAVGGGGQWFGLVQIAPATARSYGCQAATGDALRDGTKNLSCAIRIAAANVGRDGVVAAGGRGLAADWGPFHSSAKREEMRNWVRQQSYCAG